MSSYTSITTNNLNSNSNNDFSSINNKKKIWNIMNEIGLFDNVDKSYVTFIKNDFDKQIAFINNIISVLSCVEALSLTQNIPKIIQDKYIHSELLAAQITLDYMNPGSITNPITVERRDICESWMIYTKYILQQKNSKKASKLAKKFKCTLMEYKKNHCF